MKSFKRYQYRRFPTEDGAPANGDYIYPDVTIRFKDGYLNDSSDEEGHVLPAVETQDGSHIEHWENGFPVRIETNLAERRKKGESV